jgi:hypothetical protein
MVKLLWMSVLLRDGKDVLKKLKQEQQHVMTDCGLHCNDASHHVLD